jgi:DNA-binding transcriptional LysR family regulator
MDRLQLMSVFIAVVDEQGFAAAARRLNMSAPAVTRSIAALEAHLGVKLLQRSTRVVKTTDAGLRYLEDARRIIQQVEIADETVAGINTAARGLLTVTAPVLFGRMFVMPGVVNYLRQYPLTSVSVLFLDRSVNLLEEGIDVGVRIGHLRDSSMRAIRVGSVRIVLCASPEYLQQHGKPDRPEDLQGHHIITSRAGNHLLDLRFKSQGREREQQYKARLSTNTNDAAMEAALLGFGITRLLSYQIATSLSSGRLQPLLTAWEPDPLPVHILHNEGRYTASKVRSFVDLLADQLKTNSALQG